MGQKALVATTLVIMSEAVLASQSIPPEPSASPSRRKHSDVTIELGRGRGIRVDSDIDTDALGRTLDIVLGRQ